LADRPFLIGIGGGSGSGKTTLAAALVARLEPAQAVCIQHDAYYRDLFHLAPLDRAGRNFDHPDALESELLVEHLASLTTGRTVRVPVYDFAHHCRTAGWREVAPCPVIVVEGVLLFAVAALVPWFDLRVFIDSDPDLRLIRRLRRDVAERGRTVEQALAQYSDSVRPMHRQYVEPSRRHADLVVPADGRLEVAVDLLAARARCHLRDPNPDPRPGP
jgi:uridine kinase